ncbi:hypothetical protein ETD86_37150 [Nonomuraea turkmeniaca]|uniref:Uncharacterized protein n=1 Tax=Nonomuraea turkmeniaca TaxID=103838 RepID=A0A5S4F581_9ACTN|nr:hypothetical protein [Nonomuraea turkmeniaca]TMR11074.1 hypothetical protein ETD86_37150 [Nonomuraea turkmeniaca]
MLAVIRDRVTVTSGLDAASFRDADFMRRRLEEIVTDLQLAYDTIAELTDLLYGSEENPVPNELRHAMRSKGHSLRPVHLHIGGVHRTLMVPPQGRDDPIAQARLWRRIQERYGEGGA